MIGTPTLSQLLSGNSVEFEGLEVFPVLNSKGKVITGENLNPGDTYIAERNGPPVLLTVDWINFQERCVHPKGIAYPFNFGECVKVKF